MANKKCMVFETMNNINSSMHIVESSNPKEIRLTGVFGVAGVKNNNNRIYDKQNYGLMVESLQKVIATEGCLGELEHPNSMNINLNNVSHKIESIVMNEDGTVTGTIVLLDTDKGRNAQAIVKGGVPLYISSRAAGSIDESGHVTLTTLKTYDLVGTPGFSQAKLNLAENQTFESLNESMCIIYESDDLLGGDDDKGGDDLLGDDDKADSRSEDKKDDKKEDESKKKDKKSDKSEEKSDDEKSDKKKDKEDDNNKNKKDRKVDMEDLKQSIENLSKKIEDLQADLHIAKESLNEKDKKISMLQEQLDNLEIPAINYEGIQNWIEEQFAPNFKEEVIDEVDENLNSKVESIGEGVQNWAINEFAPVLEGYMKEEFAPAIQDWITEEYSPEIQNWITEEYSPEIQNWITEEYSPTVESWINEELLPVVDDWVNEECIPEHKTAIMEEMNNNVSEFLESKKTEKLTNIDNLLEAIENRGTKDEALELLKEAQTDAKYRGVYVVENMPAQYKPQWEMATESVKEDIIRRSKMYNFTKPGVLESFWNTVDFKETQVNESAEKKNNNVDSYHANIFAQMKRFAR